MEWVAALELVQAEAAWPQEWEVQWAEEVAAAPWVEPAA